MPKFNLDINGVDVEAAEGREAWKGPLPPKGSYPAILKVVKVKNIKGKEDKRLMIVATLNTKNIPGQEQYHECPAFGGVNLTEQGIPFVNQFLQSLTDGSDSEFTKIKKAFYAGFVVDEKKENVLKIGTYKINSPEGQLPILISVGHNTYNGETTASISSFLLNDGSASVGTGGTVVDDDDIAEEETDDDTDVDEVDGEEEADDSSVFDEEDEDATADA